MDPEAMRGTVRSGRIEFEGGRSLPEGTEVLVYVAQTEGEDPGPEFYTLEELGDLVGIWADRDDLGDTLEFAKNLRERAWRRAG